MSRRLAAIAALLALVATACAPSQSADTVETTLDSSTSGAPQPTSSEPPGSSAAPSTTGSISSSSTAPSSPSFPTDPNLVWTVIAVDVDDALNVRAEPDPDAEIVGTLEPWTTGVSVGIESLADQGVWRRAVAGNGSEGWVNARFLVAQPVDDPEGFATSAAIVEKFMDWVLRGSAMPEDWLAESALWVGGIGIYADGHNGWTWISRRDLSDREDWHRPRTFLFAGEDCGSDCHKSLTEYLHLDQLDSEYEILIDDLAPPPNVVYIDGLLGLARSLHRVVIDRPAPNDANVSDWQRIHFVFDWSSGKPQLSLIQTWGWTP